MTIMRMKKLYCKNCDEVFEMPTMASTNSFMIQNDPELKKRAEDGTLFKNFCPKCSVELEYYVEEDKK